MLSFKLVRLGIKIVLCHHKHLNKQEPRYMETNLLYDFLERIEISRHFKVFALSFYLFTTFFGNFL